MASAWDWTKRIGYNLAAGPAYEVYKRAYEDPANQQKDALAAAQKSSFAQAEMNRNLQLEGLNRALSFYGPARDLLQQMSGGTPPSGFGSVTQGPTQLPNMPSPALTPVNHSDQMNPTKI